MAQWLLKKMTIMILKVRAYVCVEKNRGLAQGPILRENECESKVTGVDIRLE